MSYGAFSTETWSGLFYLCNSNKTNYQMTYEFLFCFNDETSPNGRFGHCLTGKDMYLFMPQKSEIL